MKKRPLGNIEGTKIRLNVLLIYDQELGEYHVNKQTGESSDRG